MFVKGVSGNPSGRSKGANTLLRLARKEAPAAMRRIMKLATSKDERIALQANQAIVDRAYGKAAQALTGADGEGAVKHEITWLSEPPKE